MGGITTVGLGLLPSVSSCDTTPQYPVPSPKDLHILPACLFLPGGYLDPDSCYRRPARTISTSATGGRFLGGETTVTSVKGQGSERAVRRSSVLPPWLCKAKSSKDLSFLGDFH